MLIERLLALGASMRLRIVPRVAEDDEGEEADDGCTDTEEAHAEHVAAESVGQRVPHRPSKLRRGRFRYYTWAELLRRVFRVDVAFVSAQQQVFAGYWPRSRIRIRLSECCGRSGRRAMCRSWHRRGRRLVVSRSRAV